MAKATQRVRAGPFEQQGFGEEDKRLYAIEPHVSGNIFIPSAIHYGLLLSPS